jgi:hypothetical protein
MQFNELPAKLQVCLLGGVLAAIEGEAVRHKSKLAGIVSALTRNIGLGEDDIDNIIDNLSEEEKRVLRAYSDQLLAANKS